MLTRLIAAMLAALLAGGTLSVPLFSDDGTAAPPVATTEAAPATDVSTDAPPVIAPAPETPDKISADEAKALALAHAGLTADQVTDLRAEYDLDDGIPEYDVDFRQGDWEYDYEIHAQTGEVIRWDKEYDPEKGPAPQPPATAPAPEAPEKISADEAKDLALAHVGLTADQVIGLRAEYDLDDGIPEYDVEFYADGYEYEFEIHAKTGKILSWDKEWDD